MKDWIDRLAGASRQSQIAQTKNEGPRLERLEDRFVPAVLDLTTVNAAVNVGTVQFQQTDTQPTGSGVIHSFVRLHAGGNAAVAQGYNTDARPLQYDENNSPVFTRGVALDDIPIVVDSNGVAYREFLLDINQKSSSPLLSLDELRLYTGNAPDLSGYDASTGKLAGLAPVYDLDAGGANSLMLNARLSHGSGSGDVRMLVPDALLTANGGNYVYLYSKFGVNQSCNGGFEEWAVRSQATELSSLSGYVYFDANTNGVFDTGDNGLNDVLVTLSGTNDLGQDVTAQQWSGMNASGVAGFYLFSGLRAGQYTLTEAQPSGYLQGSADVGSLGGSTGIASGNLLITSIILPAGAVGRNYDFGNQLLPPPSGPNDV
jgi:hypothetical protein